MRNPVVRIIWIALLASQVIYLIVAFKASGGPSVNPSVVTTFSITLAAVAIGLAVATIFLRRRALVSPIQAGKIDPNAQEGLSKILPTVLINLCFTESIAVDGLVLALVSHEPGRALPFAAGAFVLMYVHRPMAPDLSPPPEGDVYRPPPV